MQAIPFYKSNTIRALVLAVVAQVLILMGVADATTVDAQAGELVEAGFQLVQLVAITWAMYARTFMPTPPINGMGQDELPR